MERPRKQARQNSDPGSSAWSASTLSSTHYNRLAQLFSSRVNGALLGVSGNVIALHRPYRAVPPRSAFFSTSLHIMTSAAEKAPLLPHCTAFIPLEKQRRRIYKRRKSPPWAQRELPSPLGHFFLQDGARRAIIFKLARQAPSNLPLCERAKPAKCSRQTRRRNRPNAKALRE